MPKHEKLAMLPYVYLNNIKLTYVNSFTYLGHVINSELSDDDDIEKEMRKLCVQGNTLIRKFGFCNLDVKCCLFRSYCYSLYCSSLWSDYRVCRMNKLKVIYNDIMRRLANVPPYSVVARLYLEGWGKEFSGNKTQHIV